MAEGDPEKKTAKELKKGGGKVPADKKELKKKIRSLKSEKETLLKENNKSAALRLRKKMKRLKRLTKRAA